MLTRITVFTTEECINCSVLFAMPDYLVAERRRDHGLFYCPNGHAMHYNGKSEAERLRDELDREQKRRESERLRGDSWRDQAHAAERSRNAMKGQVTKIKKRVAKGVCPLCTRSFPNLHNHMHTEHPDFSEKAE